MNDPHVDRLITHARTLLEPARAAAATIRAHAATADLTHPIPDLVGEPIRAGFVDGAVAAEQTDALTWVTACGIRQDPAATGVEFATHAVAPVSSDTERARSALMASCELLAATTAPPELVVMDGGLLTPLLSVAHGLTVNDPDVARVLADRYREIDLPAVVAAYIDLVEAGRVAALPKQDTATGYIETWSKLLRDPEAHVAMIRLRDRALLTETLTPGQWVTPRPAVEARRIEVRGATDGAGQIALSLDTQFERVRALQTMFVTYFAPRRMSGRVIKVEYVESDPAQWERGQRLIAFLDGETIGPRVKEPLPQHQVDVAAKRLVTANMASVLREATTQLESNAATAHYRS